MTEQEWLEINEPAKLAQFLKGRVGEYRFHDLAGRWIDKCLEFLPEDRLDIWNRYLKSLVGECEHPKGDVPLWEDLDYSEREFRDSLNISSRISSNAVDYLVRADDPLLAGANAAHAAAWQHHELQAEYLREFRDIAGNPFRPVVFQESWRSETVCALAKSIVAQSAFDRMPILADALEEAGCDSMDVLNHCRLEPFHVAECWVLDAIKGLV